MRVLQQAKLMLLAAVIFMAPLLCVRFCQLREDAAHPLAQHHTAPAHAHHADDVGHHAPLNDLQAMVLAVTEFVPAAVLAVVMAVTASWAVPLDQRLRKLALDVLTPPPRFIAV